MDADFWASRIAAAKRQFNLQSHHPPIFNGITRHTSQLDRLSIDEVDVEEEVRPEYPCPYCYEDFDITSLCSHLEDDHSCESKPTVCPICAVKVSRDIISHITVQHGQLLKLQRRRRLRKAAVPSSQAALSILGKDLREAHLQALLGGGGGGGGSSGFRSAIATATSSPSSDPFLSSLVLNFAISEADEISSEDTCKMNNDASRHVWKLSFDPSLSYEEREEKMEQANGRARFLQDLFASALLADQ